MRFQATWKWKAPLWGPYSLETLTIDDAMGRRNRPYARYEKWSINGQGFQGPELRIPKPEGKIRIGVAGASEIFGLYETPGYDVTSRIRGELERLNPGRFEVVNLSTVGMSIPRVIDLYDRWIRKYDFNAILYYPSPSMYLDVKAPSSRRSVTANSSFANASVSSDWNLRLPIKTWEMLRERLPDRLQVELKRYLIERERNKHPADWVWEHTAPEERVELFRQHLLELIEVVEKDGTQVVVTTHANRFRNIPIEDRDKYIVGWMRFYPRANGETLLDIERKGNQVVRELREKDDVPIVDLDIVVGKDSGRFADCVHFTDTGASVAAKAMVEKILSLYP
ncbi:MAG: hypothetical protein WC899_01095 [bacterium]